MLSVEGVCEELGEGFGVLKRSFPHCSGWRGWKGGLGDEAIMLDVLNSSMRSGIVPGPNGWDSTTCSVERSNA
jgi:hypothetical protein